MKNLFNNGEYMENISQAEVIDIVNQLIPWRHGTARQKTHVYTIQTNTSGVARVVGAPIQVPDGYIWEVKSIRAFINDLAPIGLRWYYGDNAINAAGIDGNSLNALGTTTQTEGGGFLTFDEQQVIVPSGQCISCVKPGGGNTTTILARITVIEYPTSESGFRL